MKKTAIITILLVTIITTTFAASEKHPNDAYFQGDVYLSDDSNNSLKSRIPAGNSMSVSGNNVLPATDYYIWQGSHIIKTNGFIRMMAFDPIGGNETGVVIDAESGEITLKKWVTGTGWVSSTLSPTNTGTGDATTGTNYPAIWVGEAGNNSSGLFLHSRTAGSGIFNAIWATGHNADESYVSIGASPYTDANVWKFYKTYMDCEGKVITNAVYYGDGSHLSGIVSTADPIDGRPATNNVNMGGHNFTEVDVIYFENGIIFSTSSANRLDVTGNVTVGGRVTADAGIYGTDILFDGAGYSDITIGGNSSGSSSTGGSLILSAQTATANGHIILNNLPTTDPLIINGLWRSGSNLYLSTGP